MIKLTTSSNETKFLVAIKYSPTELTNLRQSLDPFRIKLRSEEIKVNASSFSCAFYK